jgi:leader peptidase (prepilin peptidase)/N-methyltransferase
VSSGARGAWLPSPGAAVALAGAAFIAGGSPPGVVLIAYVATVSLPLVNADVLFRRLPNRFTVPGLALVALVVLAGSLRALDERHSEGGETTVWILLGSLVYGASCALAWWFGGLGFGDVKLALLLGAAAGTAGLPVVFLAMALGIVGAFLGGLGHVARVACLRGGAVHSAADIPIGPALIIGFWLALFAARSCGA